ncbi:MULTISPECIES: adenylate/guanylate cyclase domain-containing protein [unclassified Mesorhizobium]|uniref:adenylate/guanylate cyclase domain-containing protein n=1 Tax=unclassified Mesorhizobium TaxID=325217 RepID=UPI000FD461DE|nr:MULTISPECIES: adenylate/guanylate cyclase domain-containing protein [unclassified Mesorhizobium]RUV90460.1 adenylate/guanylate cyclase domain-containing protein [Mesorhizobium sp. M5C.F.Ca.IN.020.14.1.1]RUV32622.1 adenylate/guanylate cyclase domain-containing protein [Mesorhizobium sp. M5C.F.Ca.IN.020.32.2.1]RWG49316.1 MAG: adenylate/guanylate cyclase domain-containing protein [Mesorhizobium sp.]RWH49268.1 MAG: adenylate/guanylate cyclase domain-containing protein [Mesorhizobium sp.]RWH5530
MTAQRRLAAILACDVVGYSRLMERDERGTLERLKTYRKDLLEPLVSEHQGRIVKLTGDGMLCEFASIVNAVTSAMAIQQALAEHEAETPEEERIRFRIGVNLGDVVCEEDGDLYGDGVNIAARLESIADAGAVVVSGTAYDHLQGKLDGGFTLLGDLRLKNIERPVRPYRVETDPSASVAAPPPLPAKPSIAVLPFTNMSGDPDQEYFADGLVEDIITGLSRVNSFFVIARNSSFTYKGRAVDLRQVGRELGVRYVLEGSIRRAGSRVRISGQLVDAISGHHVWADRFEGDVSDIFDLQDKVTESVVGAVEPSIRLEEIKQARMKPTVYIGAYDLYLRALPRFYSMTREGFADVRRLTNEALSIDPGFTLAKALGAYIRSLSVSQCWHEPDDIRVAVRMAREVLADARDDPTSLRFASQVIAYSAKDYETALDTIERSLLLNPNSAQGYTGSGWVNAHSGRPLVAIEHFHRAMRLSPVDPEKGIALSGIGMSYLMLERYEEALAWGERALREMPNYGSSHRVVIMALVKLNRPDEAQAAARRLMEAFPTYTLGLQRQINPWRDKVFAERYVEALGIAGVPE